MYKRLLVITLTFLLSSTVSAKRDTLLDKWTSPIIIYDIISRVTRTARIAVNRLSVEDDNVSYFTLEIYSARTLQCR